MSAHWFAFLAAVLLAAYLPVIRAFPRLVLTTPESDSSKEGEQMPMLFNLTQDRVFEAAGKFQGDIDHLDSGKLSHIIHEANALYQRQLGNGTTNVSNNATLVTVQRDATKLSYRLWTNGVVPYEVDPMYTARDRAVIASAVKEFHTKTCIQFVPRTDQHDYVYFAAMGKGCVSSVGRQGGKQLISLSIADNCVFVGPAIHEMMHTLGFFHEQDRYDRDQYVTIQFDNLIDGMQPVFYKQNWDNMQLLGAYDYDSIMHYSRTAFSKNGKETVVPIDPTVNPGSKTTFSPLDLKKIGKLYNCAMPSTSVQTVPISISSTRAVTAPPPPTTPPVKDAAKSIQKGKKEDNSCDDQADYCAYWKDENYCTNPKYRDWMEEMCAGSCGVCSASGQPRCENREKDATCAWWSSQGYCQPESSFAWHVRVACKLTCKSC